MYITPFEAGKKMGMSGPVCLLGPRKLRQAQGVHQDGERKTLLFFRDKGLQIKHKPKVDQRERGPTSINHDATRVEQIFVGANDRRRAAYGLVVEPRDLVISTSVN
jgi:hypothetical protein